MLPDQDQNQPQPAPTQPFPAQPPQPDVPPVQTDNAAPSAPVPVVPQPGVSPLGAPIAPVQSPATEPVAAPAPPQPAASPIAPPVAVAVPPPTPPVAPATPAGPVVQPPLDSSQPGYVAPVAPAQPIAPMTGNFGSKMGGNKFAKLRVIIAVVVGLGVLGGAAFFAKSALLGGGISVKSLVQDEASDVSFKRPKNWTKTSDQGDITGTVFTKDGKKEKESDQMLIVDSAPLGGDYDSLSTSQKQLVIDSIKKSITDDSQTSTDDKCQGSKSDVKQITQSNYSVAFSQEKTCDNYKVGDKMIKAREKIVMGLKGDKAYMVAIASSDTVWSHSEKAFDEIFNSFKPAS